MRRRYLRHCCGKAFRDPHVYMVHRRWYCMASRRSVQEERAVTMTEVRRGLGALGSDGRLEVVRQALDVDPVLRAGLLRHIRTWPKSLLEKTGV